MAVKWFKNIPASARARWNCGTGIKNRCLKIWRNEWRQAIIRVILCVMTSSGAVDLTLHRMGVMLDWEGVDSKSMLSSWLHRYLNKVIHFLMLEGLIWYVNFLPPVFVTSCGSTKILTYRNSLSPSIALKDAVQKVEYHIMTSRWSLTISKGEGYPQHSVISFTQQPSFRKAWRWVKNRSFCRSARFRVDCRWLMILKTSWRWMSKV